MADWDDIDAFVLPSATDEETLLHLKPASPVRQHVDFHAQDTLKLPRVHAPPIPGSSPQKRQRIVSASTRRVRHRGHNEEGPSTGAEKATSPEEETWLAENTSEDPWPLEENSAAENTSIPGNRAGSEANYADFVDSVLVGAVGFFQLSKTLFVVQGWDKRTGSGTVGSTFNLIFIFYTKGELF